MSENIKKLFSAILVIILATVSTVVIVAFSASVTQSIDGAISSSEDASESSSENIATSGSAIEHPDGLELSPGSLDWGELRPFDNSTRTITVTNLLNSAATLYLLTDNWSPANASDYFKLSWDYSGVPIPPASSLYVNVTLTVSADDFEGIPPTYSFDVTITGVWG